MKNVSLKEVISNVKMSIESRSIKLIIVTILLYAVLMVSFKFSSDGITSTNTFITALLGIAITAITYILILDIYLKMVSREFIYNLKQINDNLCKSYEQWAHNVEVSLKLDPKETAHKKNLYYLVLNSNYFYFKLQIPKLLRYVHKMSEIDKTIFDFERSETSMDFITTMERKHPELIKIRKDAWFKDELEVLDNSTFIDKIGSLFAMTFVFSLTVISSSILIKFTFFIFLIFCTSTLRSSLKNQATDLKNEIIKQEFFISEYDGGALTSLYEMSLDTTLNKKWGKL